MNPLSKHFLEREVAFPYGASHGNYPYHTEVDNVCVSSQDAISLRLLWHHLQCYHLINCLTGHQSQALTYSIVVSGAQEAMPKATNSANIMA